MAKYWKASRMLDGTRVRKGAEVTTAADRRLAAKFSGAVTDTFPRTKPAEEPKGAGGKAEPKGTGGGKTEEAKPK